MTLAAILLVSMLCASSAASRQDAPSSACDQTTRGGATPDQGTAPAAQNPPASSQTPPAATQDALRANSYHHDTVTPQEESASALRRSRGGPASVGLEPITSRLGCSRHDSNIQNAEPLPSPEGGCATGRNFRTQYSISRGRRKPDGAPAGRCQPDAGIGRTRTSRKSQGTHSARASRTW